jgi:hypothetical protein
MSECIQERGNRVWHLVLGNGDADFQPIYCGLQDGSGINLPGNSQMREPTCPSCIHAASPRNHVGDDDE